MPIADVILQPFSNSINAAYSPVILKVRAFQANGNAKPPVVYCDIYFNNVYYKTISKTQHETLNATNSDWAFDIQDAAQEYLQKYIAPNGGQEVVAVTPMVTRALCKFRASGYDADGFILQEYTAPVQGTGDSDPVAGSGVASNEFFIVNAVLSHEDNSDLAIHLNSYKKRAWASSTWPLSHRPDNYKLCTADSDYFPILHQGEDLKKLVLNYKYFSQQTYHNKTVTLLSACPLVTGIEAVAVDNGNGTQTITFTFDTIDAAATSLDIQVRPANSSDPWASNEGATSSPRSIIVDSGFYDVRFITSGNCNSQASPVIEDIGASECEPVEIIGDASLPNAMEDDPYSKTIQLSGTPPFNLVITAKPTWMTIAVAGSFVNLTGTPGSADVAPAVQISFSILNCIAPGSVSGDFESVEIDEVITVEENVEKNFIIANAIPHAQSTILITAMSGETLTDVEGTFPINGTNEVSGKHDGFTGAISVNISNPENLSLHTVKLFKNGLLQQCKNITNGNDIYVFDAVTFLAGDICYISVNNDGPCIF